MCAFLSSLGLHSHLLNDLHLTSQNMPRALGRVLCLALLVVGFQGHHTKLTLNSPHRPDAPPALVECELDFFSLFPPNEVLQLSKQLRDNASVPLLPPLLQMKVVIEGIRLQPILAELVLLLGQWPFELNGRSLLFL